MFSLSSDWHLFCAHFGIELIFSMAQIAIILFKRTHISACCPLASHSCVAVLNAYQMFGLLLNFCLFVFVYLCCRTSSDAHSNVTNDSLSPATPSPPISSSLAAVNSVVGLHSFSVPESLVNVAAISQQQQLHHRQSTCHSHDAMSTSNEDTFCLLGSGASHHTQPSNSHRSYYFLPQ